MSRAARPARSQRGQAMTEFVIISLVLIPLFLVVPLIAKYQDIAHATQMASRYVAFDAITRNAAVGSWKPAEQLAGEVRRRFFSNSAAPIKTGDTAGNFAAHQNAFWRDPTGAPLIKDFDSDVRISFGAGKQAAQSGSFGSASDGKPFGVMKELLDLEAPGMHTANVSVAIANLPAGADGYTRSYALFSNIGLVMTRHTSLVLDPWTGRGAAQVESRIDKPAVFPGRVLRPAAPVVDIAVQLVESPSCFHGGCTTWRKLGELEFWRDTVPADRVH